ncbi:elongation factor G [Lacihabitans sp. LS3-19]|uniref:elongation factor G n=1 Tax=Lacihabitans sp. LS3-19 TaxID=2487335 RepID=UPI0020CE68C2|nr:elongation factor G [Lacihabitans sp. LS3-19]MCP9767566.1 elongation factor G [Lacihabitans sp. LS3-19]
MNTFDTNHVKNIALLGHSGCGKTTFAESMLFESGAITRRGSIVQNNTVSDYHELEKQRGSSVFSSLMHTTWRDFKINIIDTPGYDDFVGEVISALRVSETGVILLNAEMGVEVGTDIIWEYTEKFKTPTIFVVNQIDKANADFEKTLGEAKTHFGPNVVAVQYPVKTSTGEIQIIDVLNMVMYTYSSGKPEKNAIPDSEKAKAEEMHRDLVEAIAANDEGLMEKYFEIGELTEDEMKTGLHLSMIKHDLFPVFCASAEQNIGVGRIMSYIDNICPSANEMPPILTSSGKELKCSQNGPACIFVFKTIIEPHIGELSLFKVYSGKISVGMELVNENTEIVEKINQLLLIEGHNRVQVDELMAGDIGATIKLKSTHVNNTLHGKGVNIEFPPIDFPIPNMTLAISTINPRDEEKLAQALHILKEEDASLSTEVSSELKQTLLHCQGDLHLRTIEWKLKNIHKLDIQTEFPKVPYRETIQAQAEAIYRHKKQSGGAGQFGEVSIRIEPWYEGMPEPKGLNVRGREEIDLDWGGKLVFFNCIVGGAIDARFLPAILKGVMEKMQNGPLTGSFARDIRVSVFDGKMHPVDSNDISFKIAGQQAFKQAFHDAHPQLLEPLYKIEVLCPVDYVGAVMGDLQIRLGIVEGIETEGHFQKISAKVPFSQMHDYSSGLRGLTQGRARYVMTFAEYAPVSFEIQKKLVEEHVHKNTEELV